MTNEEIVGKIDWEGGVDAALRYGVTANDIEDDDLREKWLRLEEAFWDYAELEAEVEEYLGIIN